MAQDALDRAVREANLRTGQPCSTATLKLVGSGECRGGGVSGWVSRATGESLSLAGESTGQYLRVCVCGGGWGWVVGGGGGSCASK